MLPRIYGPNQSRKTDILSVPNETHSTRTTAKQTTCIPISSLTRLDKPRPKPRTKLQETKLTRDYIAILNPAARKLHRTKENFAIRWFPGQGRHCFSEAPDFMQRARVFLQRQCQFHLQILAQRSRSRGDRFKSTKDTMRNPETQAIWPENWRNINVKHSKSSKTLFQSTVFCSV